MKKMTQLLLIAGLIFAGQCIVYGQPGKIAKLHNGSSTFYTDLTAALAASVNGDTLYLPGGPVYISGTNITIDKNLVIIGAGHYPDSTIATYPTIIPGHIFIITGADGGLLCGIKCLGVVSFGTSTTNHNVNNYKIMRCYLTTLSPSVNMQSSSQNILISENVIMQINIGYNGPGFLSVSFEKNIFNYFTDYSYSANFKNNIFYNPYSGFIQSTGPCVFDNCIIIHSGGSSLSIGSPSTIFNNLLVSYVSPNNPVITYAGTVNNPIAKEATTSTFINANTTGFSYSNNYHLKTTSNGHNAGIDGTDVGIYGTSEPYKESAVPFNPHISSKNIGSTTSPTGTLSVDVKVVAQDR